MTGLATKTTLLRSWTGRRSGKSRIIISIWSRNASIYNEYWKNLRLPRQSQWSLVLIFRWGKNRISILEKSIICIPLAYIFGIGTRKKHNFLLPSKFSLLSTQQKCAGNKRNKTSRSSALFCTKNHQILFSSLRERVDWRCHASSKTENPYFSHIAVFFFSLPKSRSYGANEWYDHTDVA